VPLKGDLVTTSDVDGLGGLDACDVTLNGLGGHVQNGVVVGRRVDVSTSLVSNALILSVDKNVPD
jgi:hypothetical protein